MSAPFARSTVACRRLLQTYSLRLPRPSPVQSQRSFRAASLSCNMAKSTNGNKRARRDDDDSETNGHAHPSNHQIDTSTEGIQEWKKRPPYRVHEQNDGFKARYDAGCHCGKVTFQLSREEPLDSKLCHCTTCQSQHAAPFQWAAIFHKTDINFTNGHHNLEWYDPSSKSTEHHLPCKVRCSYCHSPIMDEGRNMILLFPSLVKFKSEEDRKKWKPRMHMFYGQRVVDIPDGLPKWAGLNDQSDLMEDSPPELIKERERKTEKERQERFKKGENK